MELLLGKMAPGQGVFFSNLQRTMQRMSNMGKKATTKSRNTVFSTDDFSDLGKKRLGSKQIKALVEELVALPNGAALPDWSHLSVGNRFAVARQLVPKEHQEELFGLSRSSIYRFDANGSELPVSVLVALAAETEIPFEWFLTGKAMERRPPLVVVTPDSPQADPDDVQVQRLAFKAAAGKGELIMDDAANHVSFPRFLIQQAGVPLQHARLMEASGESMYNTINDGDLMLIDVSPAATQIVDGKIFVFGLGNEAFVKRLKRTGERVVMVSDNRDLFPEEPVPTHVPFKVYGRVKWSGRNH